MTSNSFDQDSFSVNSDALIALNSIGDAVICTDIAGNIAFINGAAEKVTGWTAGEARGYPLNTVFKIMNAGTRQPDLGLVEAVLRTDKPMCLPPNTILVKKNGDEILVEDSSSPIHNEIGVQRGVVIVFRDVSVAQARANKMAYLAQHDALTNLPNRVVLDDRISQAMKVSKRHRSQFALLYIDLDNFKTINDTYSHAVGDCVLQEVASRLKYCMRDSDTVSRVGGDEFIVLMCDFDDLSDVMHIAQKILSALAMPYVFNKRRYAVTASVGISVYPDNGLDANEMINHADAAMYQAKRLGGNKLQFIELAQFH